MSKHDVRIWKVPGSGGAVLRAMRGIVVALLVLGTGRTARAQSETNVPSTNGLPRWEVGVFGAGARLPLYRGSDEHKDYFIPMPYVIYRGRIVQVDREGVRGLFYRGKWIETDISMGGNPPVSDGAEARRGMADLNPLIEAGPAVRGFLYRGEKLSSLYLELAGRGVASIDVSDVQVQYEGQRASLSLVVGSYRFGRGSTWILGGRTGVDFSDHSYNSYFYDVSESEAIPGREAYTSDGGYGGWTLSGFILRRIRPGLSASVYARWDNIDGAVYEDSPLVKTENNYVMGAAVMWKIAESKTKVGFR
jgi:outer membrane protein